MLRRRFETNRGGRELHNQKIHNCTPCLIYNCQVNEDKISRVGYVWKRKRIPTKFLVVNLKEKALRRPLSRWENNVEMDLEGTGWECVDFVHGSGEGWLV